VRYYFVWLLLLLAAACTPRTGAETVIPPETPLFESSVIGYGVVNQSFANILGKTDAASDVLGFIRKGGIVKIMERRADLKNGEPSEIWIYVTTEVEEAGDRPVSGWLREPGIDRYENLPRAQSAARLMPR
jgi:hypothetical protein